MGMKVQNVGIACDQWKAPIFEKQLTDDGWTFKTTLPGTDNPDAMTAIKVRTRRLSALKTTLEKCQKLAAESKNGK